MRKSNKIIFLISFLILISNLTFAANCTTTGGVTTSCWADTVIGVSSTFGGGWDSSFMLGAPDASSYGDVQNQAWAALEKDNLEWVILGYDTPLATAGAIIKESWNNGFVYQIDARNSATGVYTTVWTGTDPTPADSVASGQFNWPLTAYTIDALKVYINGSHVMNGWEEIDALQLGINSHVWGCNDPTASNYNPDATQDDGSCTYGGSPAVPEFSDYAIALLLLTVVGGFVSMRRKQD